MTKIRAKISGVHGYLPPYILTNQELETMVDTTDTWILTRTGIRERHILKDPLLATSDMAVQAVAGLLEKTRTSPGEVDLLICSTVTPDMVFPASANIICDKAGIKNAFGFDVNAACSGFLFALVTGTKYVESGTHKKVIVVGSDKMSAITDYTNRETCVLFGDAAAAVLLEPSTDDTGIRDAVLRSDGAGRHSLYMKAGGSLNPSSHETVDAKEHFVYQEGQAVFKFAVTKMADVTAEIMARNRLTSKDVAWLVPHQANLRIIDATARRMGIGKEQVMVNIDRYGNTTDATIPLCLWDWESQLRKGDNLILASVGGGFTWGAVWVKWAY
jgi:3-oxoacyl-[acyl-carrier-protein] synthase-3